MNRHLLAAALAATVAGCTCDPNLVSSSHTVAVVALGEGAVTSDAAGIDCGTACSALFRAGTHVTLTAAPVAGGFFEGWEGDCSGSEPTCIVSADRGRSVVARFGVAVVANLAGAGRVVSDPAGLDCTADCAHAFSYDVPVRLAATASVGYRFEGWEGDCSGAGDCVLTTDTRRTVTARFLAAPTPCGWVKRFGGPYRENTGTLARDPATGRLLLTGTTQGNIDFGGGALTGPIVSYLFVAVLDAQGGYQSAFLKGRSGAVTLGDAAAWLPNGEVAVSGAWSGTVDFGDGTVRDDGAAGFGLFRGYLATWAPATAELKSFQPLGETTVNLAGFSALAADPATGRMTVAGTFAAPESFGGPTPLAPRDFDAFAAQYERDGGFRWVRGLGGPDYDLGLAVATQAGGATLVAGTASGEVNFGAGPVDAGAANGAFVASYDATGNLADARLLAGVDGGSAEAKGVAALPSGGLVLVGSYSGDLGVPGVAAPTSSGSPPGPDAFVARLGTQPWFARLGGPLYDEAVAVAVDPASEDLWVLGNFRGTVTFLAAPVTSKGGGDIFLARFSKAGALLSVRTFGGTGEDYARGLLVDPFGRLLLAGEFESTVDFGVGNLASAGDADLFLGCLAP